MHAAISMKQFGSTFFKTFFSIVLSFGIFCLFIRLIQYTRASFICSSIKKNECARWTHDSWKANSIDEWLMIHLLRQYTNRPLPRVSLFFVFFFFILQNFRSTNSSSVILFQQENRSYSIHLFFSTCSNFLDCRGFLHFNLTYRFIDN